MDSSSASGEERFTISSKQSLIEDQTTVQQQPSYYYTKLRSYRKTITVASLVLLTIIATSTILYYVCIAKEKEPTNKYLSNSSKYYCHVTPYPDLCYETMSAAINGSSLLDHDPTRIFSASIRASISEAKKASLLLNESKGSDEIQHCERWMKSSSNLLFKTLDLLGNVSDVESLTYGERGNARAYLRVAASYAAKCLSALGDGNGTSGATIEVKQKSLSGRRGGVDVVKSGVERARKCMVNGVMLWREEENILDEFYNPYAGAAVINDYYYYDYGYYRIFSYSFLVSMYAVMYLFLALVYYLFWHSK